MSDMISEDEDDFQSSNDEFASHPCHRCSYENVGDSQIEINKQLPILSTETKNLSPSHLQSTHLGSLSIFRNEDLHHSSVHNSNIHSNHNPNNNLSNKHSLGITTNNCQKNKSNFISNNDANYNIKCRSVHFPSNIYEKYGTNIDLDSNISCKHENINESPFNFSEKDEINSVFISTSSDHFSDSADDCMEDELSFSILEQALEDCYKDYSRSQEEEAMLEELNRQKKLQKALHAEFCDLSDAMTDDDDDDFQSTDNESGYLSHHRSGYENTGDSGVESIETRNPLSPSHLENPPISNCKDFHQSCSKFSGENERLTSALLESQKLISDFKVENNVLKEKLSVLELQLTTERETKLSVCVLHWILSVCVHIGTLLF